MTTYWEERKRMRLEREELAAQQPDEVLGGAELPQTIRGRRDLSWGGTTTRAAHLASGSGSKNMQNPCCWARA